MRVPGNRPGTLTFDDSHPVAGHFRVECALRCSTSTGTISSHQQRPIRDPFMPCVRRLRASEAAYVAGIVDGEGTITLTKTHRHENRRPVLSISSTERPLLEYVQLTVGVGRITNKRRSRAHHSASFAYVISSRSALALLSQITPYLHTYKLGRANLLLRKYLRVTPRNGRYFAALRLARDAFETEFFKITTRAPAMSSPIVRTPRDGAAEPVV